MLIICLCSVKKYMFKSDMIYFSTDGPADRSSSLKVKALHFAHVHKTLCLHLYMTRSITRFFIYVLVTRDLNRYNNHHTLFSSPEHKVLRVSYCDRPLSVVRRPSSVVRKLFYLNIFSSETTLLLWNHSLDFDQTSQEWSLGGPLPKLFKWFWLVA